jgi:hypothetical protein
MSDRRWGRDGGKDAKRGTVEGKAYQAEEETTIEGLSKKYPWWSPLTTAVKSSDSASKTEESATLFEGKNMFV